MARLDTHNCKDEIMGERIRDHLWCNTSTELRWRDIEEFKQEIINFLWIERRLL